LNKAKEVAKMAFEFALLGKGKFLLRHDLEWIVTVSAFQPESLEIVPVEREDFPRTQLLRSHHQRGIRQIHRMIGVSLHELKRTLERGSGKKPNG
jgi:hypothetical protein